MSIDERMMDAPNDDCRRLAHPAQWFQASAAGDRIETCQLCTLAWREAMGALGDEVLADEFVQGLRRETVPYPGVDDGGE